MAKNTKLEVVRSLPILGFNKIGFFRENFSSISSNVAFPWQQVISTLVNLANLMLYALTIS